MKGILLAGGEGTRLSPITIAIGKQLLPVFDKPMIYYPLSTLIHAGVKEVLLISNPSEIDRFERLLEDGSQFGITIKYLIQERPAGIAQGIQLSKDFLNNEPFWFCLGDNLFHGPEFGKELSKVNLDDSNCTIFTYRVSAPSEYGVAEFDDDGHVVGIEEKPLKPKSKWAIAGLYKFPSTAVDYSYQITPSSRGELEIVDVIKKFMHENQLVAKKISRGNAWFDLGTTESLLQASNFVSSIQSRQGMLVGSPEEAAFNSGLLSGEDLTLNLGKNRNVEYRTRVIDSIIP